MSDDDLIHAFERAAEGRTLSWVVDDVRRRAAHREGNRGALPPLSHTDARRILDAWCHGAAKFAERARFESSMNGVLA